MRKNYELFRVYFVAGALTFSGGLAMLPLIERELVDKRQLMSRDDLYNYTTLSQTFPGVIALNSACFVGKIINGVPGMIAASLGAIFPAFTLMLLATILYQYIPQTGVVISIMAAVRAASAAFLFSAAYSLLQYNLKDPASILIALFCLIATLATLLSAPQLIVLAGITGVILAYHKRRKGGATV